MISPGLISSSGWRGWVTKFPGRWVAIFASRQMGSHLRLNCDEPQRHHVTILNRDPIRLGTPATILADIAERRRLDRDELLRLLIEGKP